MSRNIFVSKRTSFFLINGKILHEKSFLIIKITEIYIHEKILFTVLNYAGWQLCYPNISKIISKYSESSEVMWMLVCNKYVQKMDEGIFSSVGHVQRRKPNFPKQKNWKSCNIRVWRLASLMVLLTAITSAGEYEGRHVNLFMNLLIRTYSNLIYFSSI